MNSTERANLAEGPVGRTLITLTIPMLFAILAMVVFNLVDTAFIGRLGTEELAAISLTFPVVLVISSLAGGLGIGASAVSSQAIGKGDIQAINYFVANTYIEALTTIGSAENPKILFMPLDASSAIGAIGGIGEIAKQAFNKDAQ